MQRFDSLGRRRRPSQNRGLRPLFPRLSGGLRSRAIRVAMSGEAWSRLEALLAAPGAATRPRALGELLEAGLLATRGSNLGRALSPGAPLVPSEAGSWQDWQIRKELRLLRARSLPGPLAA